MKFNNSFCRLLPPLLWAGFLFYLSSVPSLQSPFGVWDFYLRKLAHFTVYFILAILIAPNFNKKSYAWLFSALIASIYGVFDEFHQSFVPGRHMAFTDMLINSSGAFLAGIVIKVRNNAAKVEESL
ncbi:MAG: VanZ family protein [Elusimicrobia bacterium]|nr:VanZ family protein [Elusimicrobiota bacterium]